MLLVLLVVEDFVLLLLLVVDDLVLLVLSDTLSSTESKHTCII